MMKDKDGNEATALEHNVEQLLSRVRPELAMPEESKHRVLQTLQARARASRSSKPEEPRERTVIARRPWTWATAAAAALIVALILLWPGGPQHGVAWADVVRHLGEVESFTAWATLDEISPSGARKTTHARLFQKNPALSRTEFLTIEGAFPPPHETLPEETIDSITLTSSGVDRSTITRLDPRTRTAHRTTLTFAGEALESRATLPRDLVSGTWTRLRHLTSDQTRSIGEREIHGQPVVGFEADIRELIGGPGPALVDGTIRVWADQDSAIPVEVEVEFIEPDGTSHRSRYEGIRWNVQLSDDVFAVPGDSTWTILEEEVEPSGLPGARLKDGVTVRIGPRGGPPVLTEADIEAVELVEASRRPGRDALALEIRMLTTPDAGQRLRAYTSAHLGDRVVIDFNDELELEVTIAAEIGREILIDLDRLEQTPEAFERDYLDDR